MKLSYNVKRGVLAFVLGFFMVVAATVSSNANAKEVVGYYTTSSNTAHLI